MVDRSLVRACESLVEALFRKDPSKVRAAARIAIGYEHEKLLLNRAWTPDSVHEYRPSETPLSMAALVADGLHPVIAFREHQTPFIVDEQVAVILDHPLNLATMIASFLNDLPGARLFDQPDGDQEHRG